MRVNEIKPVSDVRSQVKPTIFHHEGNFTEYLSLVEPLVHFVNWGILSLRGGSSYP